MKTAEQTAKEATELLATVTEKAREAVRKARNETAEANRNLEQWKEQADGATAALKSERLRANDEAERLSRAAVEATRTAEEKTREAAAQAADLEDLANSTGNFKPRSETPAEHLAAHLDRKDATDDAAKKAFYSLADKLESRMNFTRTGDPAADLAAALAALEYIIDSRDVTSFALARIAETLAIDINVDADELSAQVQTSIQTMIDEEAEKEKAEKKATTEADRADRATTAFFQLAEEVATDGHLWKNSAPEKCITEVLEIFQDGDNNHRAAIQEQKAAEERAQEYAREADRLDSEVKDAKDERDSWESRAMKAEAAIVNGTEPDELARARGELINSIIKDLEEVEGKADRAAALLSTMTAATKKLKAERDTARAEATAAQDAADLGAEALARQMEKNNQDGDTFTESEALAKVIKERDESRQAWKAASEKAAYRGELIDQVGDALIDQADNEGETLAEIKKILESEVK